ncbi:porin [Paraburkholderia sp. J8-2]|uniref:porin n=1 Tax=Paraburkholderia sp. J8-2 TaxID=2805440 RepID=UPI002AB76CDB|nr:porin [Paraburkholderia sp. J8-2]
MKKTLLIGTTFLVVPFSALAQSTVTLYGVLDQALQYVHNTGGKSNQISLQGSQYSTNIWGLKGSEDLGGGLSAIFKLESSFDINNGKSNSGLLFGRQAYVGIKSETYGSFTFGRQFDALSGPVGDVQPNNWQYYFTAPGDVDNADSTVMFNNAVKWTSPDFHGLRVVSAYSFGGVAGATGSGQAYSVAAGYSWDKAEAAAGYLHIDNGNATLSSRGTTSATGLFSSVVNSAYSSASHINIVRAGANYNFDPITVGAYYSYSEYVPDGSSTFHTTERYNNVAIYGVYQVNPALQFEAGYDFLKSHGDSSATYHQISLAGDYLLSKRTDMYLSLGYGHASGNNGLGAAQAVIGDSWPNAGNSTQELAIVGIRHRF